MAGVPGGATMLRLLGFALPANAPPEVAPADVMPTLPYQQAEAVRIIQENEYAPVGQILAAGVGGAVTSGVGSFLGSVAKAIKSSEVPTMGFESQFMATSPAQVGNTSGWLNALVGLGTTAIKAFAPQAEAPNVVIRKTPTDTPVLTDAARAVVQAVQGGATGVAQQIKGRCKTSRRRFKVMIGPDGQQHVFSVCPPRRMNPLNPRALGRAARRLASFQRISSHVERTIEKSLRKRGVARRSTRRPTRSMGCGCY